MILPDEKRKELEAVCRPVIEWLNNNCHPMVWLMIKPDSYELSEGICFSPITDYVKD